MGARCWGAREIAYSRVAPFFGKAVSSPIVAGCGSSFLKVVRFDSVVSDVMRVIVELITDTIGVALRAAIGFYIFNGSVVRAITDARHTMVYFARCRAAQGDRKSTRLNSSH